MPIYRITIITLAFLLSGCIVSTAFDTDRRYITKEASECIKQGGHSLICENEFMMLGADGVAQYQFEGKKYTTGKYEVTAESVIVRDAKQSTVATFASLDADSTQLKDTAGNVWVMSGYVAAPEPLAPVMTLQGRYIPEGQTPENSCMEYDGGGIWCTTSWIDFPSGGILYDGDVIIDNAHIEVTSNTVTVMNEHRGEYFPLYNFTYKNGDFSVLYETGYGRRWVPE